MSFLHWLSLFLLNSSWFCFSRPSFCWSGHFESIFLYISCCLIPFVHLKFYVFFHIFTVFLRYPKASISTPTFPSIFHLFSIYFPGGFNFNLISHAPSFSAFWCLQSLAPSGSGVNNSPVGCRVTPWHFRRWSGRLQRVGSSEDRVLVPVDIGWYVLIPVDMWDICGIFTGEFHTYIILY